MSTVFKLLAVVTLVGGVVGTFAAERNMHNTSTGTAVRVTLALLLGTVVSAASLAFFAYVLDLLMDIMGATEAMVDDVEAEELTGPRLTLRTDRNRTPVPLR